MIYWAHLVGSLLCRWLPLWVTYGLSTIFAPAIFLIWREKREHAIENMARVLGPDSGPREARRLARRTFVNYGKYLVDMMRLGRKALDQQYTVEGWEELQAAMDRGKGVVIIGGHFGNSDLGAALLVQRGYPVNVITEPLSPPRWDKLVQQARAASGVHIIPLSSVMLGAFRALRAGQILMLLIDRPLEGQGVSVEFFGHRTQVPGGAAGLALRSGAAIVAGYIVRSGNRYAANMSEIAHPDTTADPQADIEALTQRFFSWLEQAIRLHPDQWFMFRPMWREEDPAEPSRDEDSAD